jgi:hypothetical protein
VSWQVRTGGAAEQTCTMLVLPTVCRFTMYAPTSFPDRKVDGPQSTVTPPDRTIAVGACPMGMTPLSPTAVTSALTVQLPAARA